MIRSNFLTNRFDFLVRFVSRQNEQIKNKQRNHKPTTNQFQAIKIETLIKQKVIKTKKTPLKSPQGDNPHNQLFSNNITKSLKENKPHVKTQLPNSDSVGTCCRQYR